MQQISGIQMSTSPKHQTIAQMIATDLKVGDRIRFRVISNSMRPLMQVGDSAVAEIKTPDKIKRGDILVLLRTHDYLTHRAIRPIRDRWQTKGDNNAHMDPLEQQRNILGHVIHIQQTAKTIDLQTPKWAILNALLAWLSFWEAEAFRVHRWVFLPFRAAKRLITTIFL